MALDVKPFPDPEKAPTGGMGVGVGGGVAEPKKLKSSECPKHTEMQKSFDSWVFFGLTLSMEQKVQKS